MLTIKKFANGRLYDMINKEYLTKEQLAEMIKKNKKIKVVLSKTGKDVTKSVITEFSPKKEKKDYNSKKIRKWIQDRVDKQMKSLLDLINLPNASQIESLNEGLQALNRKVDDLEKLQSKRLAKMQQEQTKQIARLEKNYEERMNQLEEHIDEQIDTEREAESVG